MAKVILSSNDFSYVVANSGDQVVGAAGDQTLLIQSGVTGISANSTIEQLQFTGDVGLYTFKNSGAGDIEVCNSEGIVLTQLKGAAGKSLVFNNETFAVTSTGFDVATGTAGLAVGGIDIGDTAEALDFSSTPLGVPDYSLVADVNTVNEGGSIRFTVAADNIGDTNSLSYTVSGVSSSDVRENLSGSFQLDAQGQGEVILNVLEDQLTEGTETLTVTLDEAPDASASVSINDISLTAEPAVSTPDPTGDGSVVASYDIQQQFTSGYDSDYSYTGDYRKDALLGGSMWGYGAGQGVELTYSFPVDSSQWVQNYGGGEPFNNFTPLNGTQQDGVRAALDAWAEVTNIHFTEITETADTVGDLRFGFSGQVTGNTTGWSYLPNISSYSYDSGSLEYEVFPSSGDVWLNPDTYNDSNWQTGSDNYHTLAHEIGHSLGLKHPFESDGNGTMLTGAEDSFQYSIMSYTGHTQMGNLYRGNGDGSYSYNDLPPSSPMLYDVLAMQYLYGANYDTRTGDDTYQFSADTPFMEVIWDAGGTDTLDASNQTSGVALDLNAGAFSSVGIRYLDFNTPSAAVDNLGIAFGADIENATGTFYDDIFTGNALDNIFTGNGGSDQADGGAGTDTFVFGGNYADYTVSGSQSSAQVSWGDDTVQLTGVEQLQFSDQLLNLA